MEKMNEFEIRRAGKKNKGYLHNRTKSEHSKIEKALSDFWRKENKKRPGINSGQGILQDLFTNSNTKTVSYSHFILNVTKRERFIAATVIQWLGTNCGFSYLQTALAKAGYKITKIEN